MMKETNNGPACYIGDIGSKNVIAIGDDRLLAAGTSMTGSISENCGRTWGPEFEYTQNEPSMKNIPWETGAQGMSTILHDDQIGMMYSTLGRPKGSSIPRRSWFFSTSRNQARNWSPGTPVDIPSASDVEKGFFIQYLWGNLLQLKSGRLIAPAYWEIAGRHPGMPPAGDDPVKAIIQGKVHNRVADGHLFEAANGGCYNYYSDDLGETWDICTGSMMVWPLPSENNIGGFGVCWEPVVIELRDGRVLMFMRTNVGRIYQSFSSDEGETWSLPETTELASGDVPCWLGRLRTTDDLAVVWNQSSVDEIHGGYSRGRLSIAISKDEGVTWGGVRTLELSGGMEPHDRVDIPPIGHVRPNEDLGVLPDDYTRAHYPRLAFCQDNIIVTYSWDEWVDGDMKRSTRLQIIPEKQLYR